MWSSAYAQTATQSTAQSASSGLAGLLNSTQSMKADFIQKIYDNRGKVVQQSHGTMIMQRPGKFRWEVKKPIPQLIIANQSRLWIYDPDLEQVTIRKLSQTTGETPALLLSHVNVVLDKDYDVKSLPAKSSDWRWYELVPKAADNMFASIQMGFMNNQIHEMRLQDHLGHTTLIQFTNIKINPVLPSSVFVFKAPANVDVIDEIRNKK